MDVPGQLLTIGIFFNQDCLVSALKKMSGSLPLSIKVSGIRTVNVVKDLRKIPPGGFKKKVVVILHEAIHVNGGAVAMMGGFQVGKKSLSVSVTPEDSFFLVSP